MSTINRKPSYYYAYLQSLQWKSIRLDYMRRVGWLCEHCRVRKSEIVHHLIYDRLGREQPEDLMALCRECHDRMHGLLRPANDNQLKLPLPEIKKRRTL